MDILDNTGEKPVSFNPLQDEHSRLELIACTDLIDNHKYSVDQMPLLAARISTLREGKTGEKPEKDMHLLSDTLAQNKHMTPFEHISATLRIVAPIFVFREWHRHRTQSYNEMSMRYVRAEDADSKIFRFYYPRVWRMQAKDNKQGSSSDSNDKIFKMNCDTFAGYAYGQARDAYLYLKNKGIASELCRLVLPVATYSEMYATANLRNWYAFYELRADESAQWEIRQYAYAIGQIMKAWFPNAWSALSKWKTVGLSDSELLALDELLQRAYTQQTSDEAKVFVSNLATKLAKVRRRP